MEPLAGLRSVGRRAAGPADALAQAAAGWIAALVADAVDVNALLDRVDVDRLLDRVDVDRLLERVDVGAIAGRADVDRLVQRIDLNELLAKVDVNGVVKRVDFDALVGQADLGAVLARSSGVVAGQALNVMRGQAVWMDEVTATVVERLLRRRQQGVPAAPVASRNGTPDAVAGDGGGADPPALASS